MLNKVLFNFHQQKIKRRNRKIPHIPGLFGELLEFSNFTSSAISHFFKYFIGTKLAQTPWSFADLAQEFGQPRIHQVGGDAIAFLVRSAHIGPKRS